MRARLAIENGLRLFLRVYWSPPGVDWKDICGGHGFHDVLSLVDERDEVPPPIIKLDAVPPLGQFDSPPLWGDRCARCGEPVPPDQFLNEQHVGGRPIYQVFPKRRYDTPSGELEPGCLWWAGWYHGREDGDGHRLSCWIWDDCADPRGHLMGMTPNGREWDIDGRAQNCGSPDDRRHRCWVRSGEPPAVDVGKSGGPTCSAGAGSIAVPGWHGFLRAGVWTVG